MAVKTTDLWAGLALIAAILACPAAALAQSGTQSAGQSGTDTAPPAARSAASALPMIDPVALDADISSILDQVAQLAELLGLESPPIDREPLAQALRAATPAPDEDAPPWGTSLLFEFNTRHVTGGVLTPDEDGHVVLTDARGCQTANAGEIEIVDFRRIRQDGLRGHQCVVTAMRDDIWLLNSTTVAEGADRRLTVLHTMALAVENAPETARRLGEEKVEDNILLARRLADYGLALLVQAERQAAVDADAVVDRVSRAVEALEASE